MLRNTSPLLTPEGKFSEKLPLSSASAAQPPSFRIESVRFLSTAVHENISVERISSVRPEYGKKALFKALCTCTIHPPLPTSGSPLPISFLIASFLFSGSWLLVVEQLSTTSVNQLAANHHRKMACLMDLASSKNFEKNNPCCLASCCWKRWNSS